MTWLYIDQGNSRIKAVVAHDDSDFQRVDLAPGNIRQQAPLLSSLQGICWAGVGSNENRQEMLNELYVNGVRAPLLEVQAHHSLLESDYEDLTRLGIDRWLAVLAASAKHQHAIVADVGTACTVDVLMAGRHIGGYIVPGLALQQKALADYTAAVKVSHHYWDADVLGKNTQECVGHGGLRMIRALIDGAHGDLCRELGVDQVKILITGGDGSWLNIKGAEFDPLLVFRGMHEFQRRVKSI